MTKDDIDKQKDELKEPSKEHQWHNIHRGDYEKPDDVISVDPPEEEPEEPEEEPEEEKTGFWEKIKANWKRILKGIGAAGLVIAGVFGVRSCEQEQLTAGPQTGDTPTTDTNPGSGGLIADPKPPVTPANPQPTKDDIKIGDTITVDLDGTEIYYYDAEGSQPSGKLQDDTVVISGVAIVGKDGKVVENYFSSVDPKKDARRNTCRGYKRPSR